MSRTRSLAVALTVVAVAGCDGRPTTAPSVAPSAQAIQPTVNGDITIRSASHATGATVRLHDCGSTSDDVVNSFCTADLRLALDIVLDGEVSRPVLRITFMDGLQRCAFSMAEGAAFVPQNRATLDVTGVHYTLFTDQPGKPSDLGCTAPPRTTNVVMVEVLSRDAPYPGRPLLTRTFPYTYSFVVESAPSG